MPITCLNTDYLWNIYSFLEVQDVQRFAMCRKTLHTALNSRYGDVAYWKSRVETEFAKVLVDHDRSPLSLKLADWGVSTYRRMYQVLYRCGHFTGNWRWEVPVRGGLLTVRFEENDDELIDSLVGELIIPNKYSTRMVQNVSSLHSTTLFEITFSDSEYEVDTPGVRLQKGNEVLLVGGEATATLAACSDCPVVSGRAAESAQRVFSEYMQELSYSDLTFSHLPSDKATPAGASTPEQGSLSLTGLYEGVFGPHGLEVINISMDTKGDLVGLKVTGDPNVPSGEVCFKSVGKMVEADPSCQCQYGCGCWNPARDPQRGLQLVGMYHVEAQTAMNGFLQPQWNSGRLVVCQSQPKQGLSGAQPETFVILVWDGLFSTRLAPLMP